MANTIKMRATLSGDVCTVKAIISHPMETGMRKDTKTGKVIPEHFIQEILCEHNGEQIASSNWSGAVSANPFVTFQFTGASKGDLVRLTWADNKGVSDSVETGVK